MKPTTPVGLSLPIVNVGNDGALSNEGCGSEGGASGMEGKSAEEVLGRERLPRWLKRNVPKGNSNHFTSRLLEDLRLETVCENAKCPNRMECYSQKTATFMVLGNVCTRPCGFCAVAKGKTQRVEEDEPQRLAEAAERLGLKHVVITSVTRDDLPDGGAEHFYRCILAVRQRTGATVEVLTPDFLHNYAAVERVVEAFPEVFNHNTETVPRLYREVRGRKSDYAWTLELLRHVKRCNPAVKTKSGFMLGLGETQEELLDAMSDLLAAGCDMLTLGQYLQPSLEHLSVVRYVPPEEFDHLGRLAREMGFVKVASGPFVRSSYHARELVDGDGDSPVFSISLNGDEQAESGQTSNVHAANGQAGGE